MLDLYTRGRSRIDEDLFVSAVVNRVNISLIQEGEGRVGGAGARLVYQVDRDTEEKRLYKMLSLATSE